MLFFSFQNAACFKIKIMLRLCDYTLYEYLCMGGVSVMSLSDALRRWYNCAGG